MSKLLNLFLFLILAAIGACGPVHEATAPLRVYHHLLWGAQVDAEISAAFTRGESVVFYACEEDDCNTLRAVFTAVLVTGNWIAIQACPTKRDALASIEDVIEELSKNRIPASLPTCMVLWPDGETHAEYGISACLSADFIDLFAAN